MLSSIPFATFCNYSPRGGSELSRKSQKICGLIKNGNPQMILKTIPIIKSEDCEALHPFLSDDTTLVPIPRSSLLVENGLWPTKVIADVFVENGLGSEVLPCLVRTTAVAKSSSTSSADQRPSVQTHFDSLTVNANLLAPQKITLIDDVLTLGRTSLACASKLKEAFPDAEIRMFAMMRTRGFIPNIENLVDPQVGNITYNSYSGKTSLPN